MIATAIACGWCDRSLVDEVEGPSALDLTDGVTVHSPRRQRDLLVCSPCADELCDVGWRLP